MDEQADRLYNGVKDIDLEDSDEIPTLTLSETVYQLGDVKCVQAPRTSTVAHLPQIR